MREEFESFIIRKKFADRILFMDKGLIVEAGIPQQLLRNPETDRLKLFLKQLGEMNQIQS